MDCNTARLFLQLGRPGARDLGDDEATELDAHLRTCGTCQQLAHDQDRLDRHLGSAMRAVEVPAGLKEQILMRLDADRGARHRRWAGRGLLGLGAAAALLLAGIGLAWLLGPARTTILAEDVLQGGNVTRAATVERANDQLRKLGTFAGAPTFTNYKYLSGTPALAILPGTEDWKSPVKVPQLVFVNGKQQAWVYMVPERKFEVLAPEASDPGYPYSLDVHRPSERPDSDFIYLILHTGKNWDWLRAPRED